MIELQTMDHDSGGAGGAGGSTKDTSEERAGARPLPVRDLEQILRGSDPGLVPGAERFQAALILLAGAVYGQNVELLARRTGIARPMVARVARRLIDNGVWQAGSTAADWAVGDPPNEAFWNDVAVAEGRMCRRINQDGSTEWAPAGFWNKNFQFVDPAADARLSSTYLDPNPSEISDDVGGSQATADAEPEPEPVSAQVVVKPGTQPHRKKPALWLEPPQFEIIGASAAEEVGTVVSGPIPAQGPPEELPPGRRLMTTVPSLDELFGNVTWIG